MLGVHNKQGQMYQRHEHGGDIWQGGTGGFFARMVLHDVQGKVEQGQDFEGECDLNSL